MTVPALKALFATLIAESSVSCTQAALDQSNAGVIARLAGWFGALGFACDPGGDPGQVQPDRHPGQRAGRSGAGWAYRYRTL
ncbi:hypothetical protein thsps117_18360 [Pseudomonas sp. No.117]